MKKAILFWMMLMAMNMCAQEEYHIKTFGKNDDLRTRGVTCVTQINGFIWVGTSSGFYAFDGKHIHEYKIPDEEGLGGYYRRVTSLTTSAEGVLWVGSRRGIYVFNMSEERLYKLTAENLPESPNVQQILFDQEGNLWGIMDGKVYIIDVKQNKAERIGEGLVSPGCITVAKDGTVWLGDSEGILYRYDAPNHRLRSYNVKPEGVNTFRNLTSITEMRNGLLALVSFDTGVCLFSPDKFTSKMVMTHDDEGAPIVAHTSITPNGDDLWVGTERGVLIYRMRDGQVKAIRQSRFTVNSLSDNAVHSLFVDKENGVWVGTYFGGMNRISLSQHNFSIYLTDDETEDVDVIREICGDNFGRLWVGTEDGGLYLVDKARGTLHLADVSWGSNPPPFNAQGMVLVGDDLWVSSITNGVYVIDTRTMQLKHRYEKTNKSNMGRSISAATLCYQNETIFAGSSQGVYIFDEKAEEFNMIPELNGVYAHHLYADRHGNVWVSSFNKGLWKIQQQKDGTWKAKQTAFNYMSTTVIMEDSKGLYWVGTDIHGLMSYDDKTGKTEQLDVSETLKQETVTNILEDTHHRLWINTFNGLYSYNLGRKVMNHVTMANGLPSTYLNYASGYVDQDGIVYIGTYKGMISFNPASFILSRERLRPYFLNLYVNGQHILPNDETGILQQTLFLTKQIRLSRDQNTFSINYAVPTYRSGEIVWYRYRLNPDEPWVVTDNGQPIQLTNLSAGTYKITLQASYNPERWEGEAASIIVVVEPPIWLSPYAFICYATLIVLIVIGVMSYFKRRASKKSSDHVNQKEEETVK